MESFAQNIKAYFFVEDDKAFERLAHDKLEPKTKSAVIAEVRNKKNAHEIKKFNVVSTENGNEYFIVLEDKTLYLVVSKEDPSNAILNTILNENKMAKDEVIIRISENKFTMSNKDADEIHEGKNINEMITFLKCMQKNGEIESVEKRGTKYLEYIFETKENEKIRILTEASNQEIVSQLDEFPKNKIQKKNGLKAVIAASVVGVALAVSHPYIGTTAHNFVTQMVEKDNANFEIETNFERMSSYYTRLVGGNLTKDDYESFRSLVSKMKTYYEENNKTTSFDYETLLKYESTIEEHYSSYYGRVY